MLINKFLIVKRAKAAALVLQLVTLFYGCKPSRPEIRFPQHQGPSSVQRQSVQSLPSTTTMSKSGYPSAGYGDTYDLDYLKRVVGESSESSFSNGYAGGENPNYSASEEQIDQRSEELERQRRDRVVAEELERDRLATQQRERDRLAREQQEREPKTPAFIMKARLRSRMNWAKGTYLASPQFRALPAAMQSAVRSYIARYENEVGAEYSRIVGYGNPGHEHAPYFDSAGFEATLVYDSYTTQIWNRRNSLTNPSENPYDVLSTESKKRERHQYMRLERLHQILGYEMRNYGRLRLKMENLFSIPEDSILPACPYASVTENDWSDLCRRVGLSPFHTPNFSSWMTKIKEFKLNDSRLLEVRQMLEYMLSAQCPEELRDTMALTLAANGTTCLNAAEAGRVQGMKLWEDYIDEQALRRGEVVNGEAGLSRAIRRKIKKQLKVTFERMINQVLTQYATQRGSAHINQPEARSFMLQQLWRTFGIGDLPVFNKHWGCGSDLSFYIGNIAPKFIELLLAGASTIEGKLPDTIHEVNTALGYTGFRYDSYSVELFGYNGTQGIFAELKAKSMRSLSDALNLLNINPAITRENLGQFIARHRDLLTVIANHMCLSHPREFFVDVFALEAPALDAAVLLKGVLYQEVAINDLTNEDFTMLASLFGSVGNNIRPIAGMYEVYLDELREHFAFAKVGCMTDSDLDYSCLIDPEAIEAMESIIPGGEIGELRTLESRRNEILASRYYVFGQSNIISDSMAVRRDERGVLVVSGNIDSDFLRAVGVDSNSINQLKRLIDELRANITRTNEINARRVLPQANMFRCAPLRGIRNELPGMGLV